MPGKNIYRIGTDGTANFPTLASIPAELLAQQDTTFFVLPGTYTGLTNAILDDAAFIGQGDREEIVINGPFTIANTSANTNVFENLTFVGSNSVAASGVACVTKLGAASTPLHFRNVVFSNADIAVAHNGERAFATTTRQVSLDRATVTTDKGIVANANVEILYSRMNTTSNTYFTPGTGGGAAVVTVTVLASTSGGANTGNCTKVVTALLS